MKKRTNKLLTGILDDPSITKEKVGEELLSMKKERNSKTNSAPMAKGESSIADSESSDIRADNGSAKANDKKKSKETFDQVRTMANGGNKNIDKKRGSTAGAKAMGDFERMLSTNSGTGKKDQFMFSLSGDLCNAYEKLALIYHYKTGVKLSRNMIMRKVLEDYHERNVGDLLKIIDKI